MHTTNTHQDVGLRGPELPGRGVAHVRVEDDLQRPYLLRLLCVVEIRYKCIGMNQGP